MQIRRFATVLGLSLLSVVALSSRAQTSQTNAQSTSGNTLSENEAAAAQLDHPVQITSAALDAMALTKTPPVYPQAAKDQALEALSHHVGRDQ